MILNYNTIFLRGDTFRKTLLRIGEVRSLVSSSVHMMALTATANKTLRNQVISVLGMKSPKVVAVSPAKFNLMYIIKRYDNIQDAFATILKGIQEQRTNFLVQLFIVNAFMSVDGCISTSGASLEEVLQNL